MKWWSVALVLILASVMFAAGAVYKPAGTTAAELQAGPIYAQLSSKIGRAHV